MLPGNGLWKDPHLHITYFILFISIIYFWYNFWHITVILNKSNFWVHLRSARTNKTPIPLERERGGGLGKFPSSFPLLSLLHCVDKPSFWLKTVVFECWIWLRTKHHGYFLFTSHWNELGCRRNITHNISELEKYMKKYLVLSLPRFDLLISQCT